MIEDFDNTVEENDDERRWADEEDSNGIIGWLKRQCTWRTLISPVLFLVFLCGLLWYDRETVDLIIKHSYGDVLFRFFAISFILVLPIEFICEFLMKLIIIIKQEKTEGEVPVWALKLPFVVMYFTFVAASYDIMKRDIDKSKLGPQHIAISYVSDKKISNGKGGPFYYINFKIEDEPYRIKYTYSEWRQFTPGDVIVVTYQRGCLNGMFFNEIENISYPVLYKDILIDPWKIEHGKTISDEELESLRPGMVRKVETGVSEQKSVYGPDVEKSLGEYLKERLPAGKGIADGWTEASFTIDGDGNVHKVKTSSMRTKVGKALHKALIDMGKWIGKHEKGKTEKVNISLVYLDNMPNYLIVERKVTSADGSTLEINDEYDMNYKKRNVVVWTAHEEK